MDKIKITYIDSEDKKVCYLTAEQSDYLGLNNTKEYVTLTLGLADVRLKKVLVSSKEVKSYGLYLSKDIESQLYIKQDTVLQIRKIDDEHLEVGPYIGIFINEENIKSITDGRSSNEYIQFNIAGKKLSGLVCLFSIENIDWSKKLVPALVREGLRWVIQTLPLPKIIYDRNVGDNCRTQSRELRKRLKDTCKIYNPMAKLAKWETIKAIKKNPVLISIMPTTVQYTSFNDLENSLNLYPSVYLKPDSLSKGQGIFRISKNQSKKYKIQYRTVEENHNVSLDNLIDLETLMSRYSKKGGGYIIQQEINKAEFKGNSFDFRALFQKNFEGVWKLSGAAVRIAAEGSIITSPRSGGAVEELETILKEVFNESLTTPNGLYENILRIGREVCISIEEEFGDCIELGLDMAIDKSQRIWLIEVNGKPLKVSLKRLGNPEIMAICSRRPIEYAVKQSGFVSEDTHG